MVIDSDAIRGPEEFGFGDLFDLVGEAVIVADSPSGTIQLWNEAASRMFGFSGREAVGMPVSVLVPAELRPSHLAGIARFAAEGTIRLTPPGSTVEVPALRRDGSQFWVELSLTALRGVHDRMVLALIRDVTDRHRAQDELKRANQALRDFVAVAAHDLRAPTAAITSGLELLREFVSDGAASAASELAELLEGQARAQLSLIEDLLDTASLDKGTVTTRPETLTLDDEIAQAAAGHDLTTSVPAGLTCFADRRHVQRIVTNLVVNAYRHGAPPVTVTARADGPIVEIAVCDAGSGVAPDLRSRLFDPYVAGSASNGTGLGLAIARGLAQAYGGDLGYEAAGPGNFCFVLRLPVAPSS